MRFISMHLQKQAFDSIEIKRPAICGALAADCSALVTPTGFILCNSIKLLQIYITLYINRLHS